MTNNNIAKICSSFFSDLQLDSITDKNMIVIIPVAVFALGQICSLASKAIDNGYNVTLKVSDFQLSMNKGSDCDE